jgi:hypothetical protein
MMFGAAGYPLKTADEGIGMFQADDGEKNRGAAPACSQSTDVMIAAQTQKQKQKRWRNRPRTLRTGMNFRMNKARIFKIGLFAMRGG